MSSLGEKTVKIEDDKYTTFLCVARYEKQFSCIEIDPEIAGLIDIALVEYRKTNEPFAQNAERPTKGQVD